MSTRLLLSFKRFRAKRMLKNLMKVAIVVLLFLWLIQGGKLDMTKLHILVDSPRVLIGFFAFWLVSPVMFCALRWYLLLQGLGSKVRRRDALAYNMIGIFFSFFMPGSVGGDIMKALYVHRGSKDIPKLSILLSLLADRAVGLFALIFYATIAILANLDLVIHEATLRFAALIVVASFVGFLAFGALIFVPGLERTALVSFCTRLAFRFAPVKQVYEALIGYRKHPVSFAKAVGYGLVHQLLSILIMVWVTYEVIGTVNFGLTFVIPIASCLTALPLAPGGLGIGHVAFEELYTLIGLSNGANIFNLSFIAQMLFSLLGVLVYLFYPATRVPKLSEKRQNI